MVKGLQEKSERILDRAMQHKNSVSYPVSLRWIFYRLVEDGLYTKKEYTKLVGLMRKARRERLMGWKQDSLQDETRSIYLYGVGHLNEKEWSDDLVCTLDKFQNQDYFIMVLYEAKAMTGQFEQYTDNVPLIPFGGDASIPHKWKIAKIIEEAKEKYGKPIKLFYFGDYDEKGKQIYSSAIRDIKNWCDVDFKVEHCGLHKHQAEEFKLSTDEREAYQWEALSDEQAKSLIESAMVDYQDKSRFKEVEEEEIRILNKLQQVSK